MQGFFWRDYFYEHRKCGGKSVLLGRMGGITKKIRQKVRMDGKASLVYNQMSIELQFSSQFLKDNERVATLMDILIKTSSNFLISNQKTQDPMVNIAINKIKLVCQATSNSDPISTFKLWHCSDVIAPIMIRQSVINVVVVDGKNEVEDISGCGNVIFVSQIGELREIFKMSIFDLEKKCKMERTMRIAQRRSKQNSAKQTIKKIAIQYYTMKSASQLGVFLSFMRYNTKWYKARIRKSFNIWLIETYEKSIEKTNEEIVKEEHLCKKSKHDLAEECFKAWKDVVRNQKNQRKST